MAPSRAGGGALSVAQDIASWVNDAGHEVMFLSTQDDIGLRPMGTTKFLWHSTTRPGPIVVAHLVRRYGVQIIHCHLDTFWIGAWAGFLTGVPSIRTLHGSLKRPGMMSARELLKSLIATHILKQFVVAVSDPVGNEVSRYLGLRRGGGLEVIPNGCRVIDLVETSRADDAIVFAFMGRLEVSKGFDTLLEAFVLLSQTNPTARLIVCGDGPLRSQIPVPLVSRGRISLSRGWLDRREARQELAKADVVVLPSETEGTPMVVLEAMTLGIPAIVSTDANMCQLVEDGRDGWVFPTGAVDALYNLMRQCVTTPEEIKRMGEHARETAGVWNERCAREYGTLISRLARA